MAARLKTLCLLLLSGRSGCTQCPGKPRGQLLHRRTVNSRQPLDMENCAAGLSNACRRHLRTVERVSTDRWSPKVRRISLTWPSLVIQTLVSGECIHGHTICEHLAFLLLSRARGVGGRKEECTRELQPWMLPRWLGSKDALVSITSLRIHLTSFEHKASG